MTVRIVPTVERPAPRRTFRTGGVRVNRLRQLTPETAICDDVEEGVDLEPRRKLWASCARQARIPVHTVIIPDKREVWIWLRDQDGAS